LKKKFSYVLDTGIEIFEKNPFLLEYPVAIVECTFLLDNNDELEQAIKKKHIHWNQLKPYVVQNPNVLFILVHFSQRYSDSQIKTFFNKVIAEDNISNIHPWLTDPVTNVGND